MGTDQLKELKRLQKAHDKRIARIQRHKACKVPQKQRKKERLWRDDGACIRLRAE